MCCHHCLLWKVAHLAASGSLCLWWLVPDPSYAIRVGIAGRGSPLCSSRARHRRRFQSRETPKRLPTRHSPPRGVGGALDWLARPAPPSAGPKTRQHGTHRMPQLCPPPPLSPVPCICPGAFTFTFPKSHPAISRTSGGGSKRSLLRGSSSEGCPSSGRGPPRGRLAHATPASRTRGKNSRLCQLTKPTEPAQGVPPQAKELARSWKWRAIRLCRYCCVCLVHCSLRVYVDLCRLSLNVVLFRK